jgi:uncharacterized membrane protein YcjF (UPF0283 family)
MLRSPLLQKAFRIALIVLNVIAMVMLAMKLIWNSFSNDDLMAIMFAVLVGNVLWALLARKRER